MQDALATFGRGARRAIDDATALNDVDTADLFTEISRAADKSLWMVEAHIQDTSGEGTRIEQPAAVREAVETMRVPARTRLITGPPAVQKIPQTIKPMKTTRSTVTGSSRRTIPRIAVPTVPIPVHTAVISRYPSGSVRTAKPRSVMLGNQRDSPVPTVGHRRVNPYVLPGAQRPSRFQESPRQHQDDPRHALSLQQPCHATSARSSRNRSRNRRRPLVDQRAFPQRCARQSGGARDHVSGDGRCQHHQGADATGPNQNRHFRTLESEPRRANTRAPSVDALRRRLHAREDVWHPEDAHRREQAPGSRQPRATRPTPESGHDRYFPSPRIARKRRCLRN